MVVRSMRMCVHTVLRPADVFAADIGARQVCQREPAERRRAGRAGRAHRPRYTVRPPLARREGPARPAPPIGALMRVRCCAAGLARTA
jgi:hypothetical protein